MNKFPNLISANYLRIGRLGKSFGVDGYLRTQIDEDSLIELKTIADKNGPLFVGIQGFKIPFFIKSYNSDQGLILFQKTNQEDIDDLVGQDLFIIVETDGNKNQDSVNALQGFQLVDIESNQVIGDIDRIEEYPAHPMLIVNLHEKEYLIPFVEDWLEGLDPESKILTMTLPEGLFDEEE